MLMLTAAALALTACGERTNPPTEPAEPVTEAPTINPTVPIQPGQGPETFVGTWAAQAAWCGNTAATTDQVPVRITAERFEGYENRCDITAIQQRGDSYDASLACEAEGMTSREQVNMRVVADRLTLTWADRSGEPVQLVRCGPAPAESLDGA
ncbi:hypothetical protein [Brevundimonas sp.]|uniref:hypothetical protein n=1 Tax=Brevundimonas sp. TaxID=1871086 RepID=UPI00391C7BED